MRIFKGKRLTGQTKDVNEIESWTLSWYTHIRGYENDVHHKVFTSKEDAQEYSDSLEKAAKFLQQDLPDNPKITKNP